MRAKPVYKSAFKIPNSKHEIIYRNFSDFSFQEAFPIENRIW